MALLHPERVNEPEILSAIRQRTKNQRSRAEFFIRGLASGVAQIAAAFYPRPVIVRFSDFKSNEYAGLLGGAEFEPVEQIPMIGFRGASRYYHERYREAFALECEAIRRVRDEMGLSNVKVMIPFCRTLGEARNVLAELQKNGLSRGAYGLEVYVMCEIPNNVVLAEEFSELFDGFSIGSNDLTQLTLGVDRVSELLADILDEQDPGVKRLIESVVKAAHGKHKKVGLCGQAPSDHPEFARFLAGIGIDSISVTSDALPAVTAVLSEGVSRARRVTGAGRCSMTERANLHLRARGNSEFSGSAPTLTVNRLGGPLPGVWVGGLQTKIWAGARRPAPGDAPRAGGLRAPGRCLS